MYEELHPPGSPGALFWPVSSSGFDAPWPAVFYNSALSLGPEEAKAAGAPPGGLPGEHRAPGPERARRAGRRAAWLGPGRSGGLAVGGLAGAVRHALGWLATLHASWPALLLDCTMLAAKMRASFASSIPPQIDEWVEESNQRAGEGYIVRARADQDTSKPPLCVPIGPGCCNLLKV